MSENCFVKTLRCSVNTDTPIYLDKMIFNVAVNSEPTTSNNWVAIGSSSTVNVTPNEGDSFGLSVDNTSTYTYPNGLDINNAAYNIYPTNTAHEVTLTVNGKKNLVRFGGAKIKFNLEQLYGCNENFNFFSSPNNDNVTGDLLVFKDFDNLTNVTLLNSKNYYGSINNFANKTSLETLILSFYDHTYSGEFNVYGCIDSLSDCINLKSLRLFGNKIDGTLSSLGSLVKLSHLGLTNTKVEGSIEEFVAAQINAGRTETIDADSNPTYITMDYIPSGVRFRGEQCLSGINYQLSWAPDSQDAGITNVTYHNTTVQFDGSNWSYNGEVYVP